MPDDNEPFVIDATGDLILDISQEQGSQQFSYRVNSEVLKANSRYFEKLLSDRFSEGRQLSTALQTLKINGYKSNAEAPAGVLPRVVIIDVGRTALSKANSIQNLVKDFLSALHGLDLSTPSPPIANLFNLAVVADRFDAAPCLASYVQRRKFLQIIDAKAKGKPTLTLTEERIRQKLFVGLRFDQSSWVSKYSKHLIMRDSVQWQPDTREDHTKAQWWDIPNGVEDELVVRREYILETINSLQAHFLGLYTSGERQCKLGYDTSLQCDSFQLGEMVRFFHKIDTVRLQGKIYDDTKPVYYRGDIENLLASLRQCSNYQVDANHAHCGLRSRLLPLLAFLEYQLSGENGALDIGICNECWRERRSQYAWSLAKRPVLWTYAEPFTGSRGSWQRNRQDRTPGSCIGRHEAVRNFFMAVDRRWTVSTVKTGDSHFST